MTIREIDQLIEEGNSLKQIAQAYSEIANLKLKRIRAQVERNRLFFEEISYVYSLVKKLAIKRKQALDKPKKRVSLLITSNYRFYGNINSYLLDFFIVQTQKLEGDRIIVGKAAIDYFKASGVSSYREVLLQSDQPTFSELNNLVNLIKDYNQVLVFYSKLKSLLTQEPTVTDITTSSALHPSSHLEGEKMQLHLPGEQDFKFIFEPELPKILKFFDSQILTLLLEQTFLESEVARTASRFITMDQAETEANKFIKEYERLKAYAKRSLESNTILENFATLVAVKKGAMQ